MKIIETEYGSAKFTDREYVTLKKYFKGGDGRNKTFIPCDHDCYECVTAKRNHRLGCDALRKKLFPTRSNACFCSHSICIATNAGREHLRRIQKAFR